MAVRGRTAIPAVVRVANTDGSMAAEYVPVCALRRMRTRAVPPYRGSMQTAAEQANVSNLREQAIERLKKRQDFRGHVLVFLLINALVWGVWALTGSKFPWPVFITGGWGVGLVMNAWEVYWRPPISEREIQAEVDRLRRRRSPPA